MIKRAREAGFSNVHDYLVHLVTGWYATCMKLDVLNAISSEAPIQECRPAGETQEEISARKEHLVWCNGSILPVKASTDSNKGNQLRNGQA